MRILDELPTLNDWLERHGDKGFATVFKANPSLALRLFWESTGFEFPETVFHYTASEVVYHLLSVGNGIPKLWLSKFSNLNDELEGNIGAELYLNHFNSEIMEYEKLTSGLACVSFCDNGDDAAIWLAYGHRGAGVAIGFDSFSMHFMNQDAHTPGFLRVVYNDSDCRELAAFLKRIYNTSPSDVDANVCAAVLCASAKHIDFDFEREYRICGMNCKYQAKLFSNSMKLVSEHYVKTSGSGTYAKLLGILNEIQSGCKFSEEELAKLEKTLVSPWTKIIVGATAGNSNFEAIEVLAKQRNIRVVPSAKKLRAT